MNPMSIRKAIYDVFSTRWGTRLVQIHEFADGEVWHVHVGGCAYRAELCSDGDVELVFVLWDPSIGDYNGDFTVVVSLDYLLEAAARCLTMSAPNTLTPALTA